MYAIHLGVTPHPDVIAAVDGHSDIETEHRFEVEHVGVVGYVTGSWTVWGEHDQHDGVEGLHVMVPVNAITAEVIRKVRDAVSGITEGRLLDYALVTESGNWSAKQAVIRLDDLDDVEVYNVVGNPLADSAHLDDLAQFQGFVDDTDVNGGDLVEYVGEILTSTGRQ